MSAVRTFPLEAYFRWGVDHHRRIGASLYALYCERCLEDPEILALAAAAPPGQPASHLLFGAVHWLLLAEPDHPLAAHYASIHEPAAPLETAWPLFRAFCLTERERLTEILRTRTVQVTLVGRNGHALPAIAEAARRAGAPLSFVDVGCSAGITTLFDHYAYDFGPLGRVAGRNADGTDGAGVEVTGCRFVGRTPRIPRETPRVARRVGIDLHPVDAADPDERRWIEALLPPDLGAERRQLKSALDYRVRTPFELITGDALEVLPALLPALADPVLVFHSHCLYQWPAAAREAFEAVLRRESRDRDIFRVAVEYPVDKPLGAQTWPTAADELPLIDEISLTTYHGGDATRELLGICDGWGRRAEWFVG